MLLFQVLFGIKDDGKFRVALRAGKGWLGQVNRESKVSLDLVTDHRLAASQALRARLLLRPRLTSAPLFRPNAQPRARLVND